MKSCEEFNFGRIATNIFFLSGLSSHFISVLTYDYLTFKLFFTQL